MLTHSTTTLYLQLIDEKEWMERKRNNGLSSLSLFFCVRIFSVSDWLQGSTLSKKGYARNPWSFVFLKINYLLGHTKKVLVLKENVASQIYYHPTHSVIDVTHSHLTLSLDEFHTSWIY